MLPERCGRGDRSNRRKTCPSATFSNTHFTWTELGSTPVFRCYNPWLTVDPIHGDVIIRSGIAYCSRNRTRLYVIISLARVFVTCCELEQVAHGMKMRECGDKLPIYWLKDFVSDWAAENIQPLKKLWWLSVGVLTDCHTLDSSVRGRGTVSLNEAFIKRV
jgi:hypothetical protein